MGWQRASNEHLRDEVSIVLGLRGAWCLGWETGVGKLVEFDAFYGCVLVFKKKTASVVSASETCASAIEIENLGGTVSE